jgi:amino acid transporter
VTAPAARAPRRATTFHLVFLTYSVVCSGAYGLEEMVSASGPGLAIAMMIALPLLWVVPLALTCAELSSHHPVEGG